LVSETCLLAAHFHDLRFGWDGVDDDQLFTYQIVSRVLHRRPRFSRFLAVKGNGKLLAVWLIAVWSVVAFGEEIIGRSFLIDRLSLVFEGMDNAPVIAVVLSSLIFGSVHFYQGVAGVVDNTITGLIFGAVYLSQNRTLWANIFSHGLIDTIALVAFYFGMIP
jgi:hypothetical protein